MKPEDLKLKNCWEGFATVAISEAAPKIQHDMMYQAFLAGADTVLQLHQALTEHAPTNVKTGMEKWRKDVQEELRRLAEETKQ